MQPFTEEIEALQKSRAELLEELLTNRNQYDKIVSVVRRIDQAILLRREFCQKGKKKRVDSAMCPYGTNSRLDGKYIPRCQSTMR